MINDQRFTKCNIIIEGLNKIYYRIIVVYNFRRYKMSRNFIKFTHLYINYVQQADRKAYYHSLTKPISCIHSTVCSRDCPNKPEDTLLQFVPSSRKFRELYMPHLYLCFLKYSPIRAASQSTLATCLEHLYTLLAHKTVVPSLLCILEQRTNQRSRNAKIRALSPWPSNFVCARVTPVANDPDGLGRLCVRYRDTSRAR